MKFTLCSRPSIEARRGRLARAVFLLAAATLPLGRASLAQVSYLARFTLEKESVLLGEPIFCDFTLQNTGTRGFTFSYRLPDRVLNRELEQEPHFTVMDEKGNRLRDPAPHPCGGAKGSVVYGSVSLPAGQVHTERWLLNQWAQISSAGRYHLRAERRLPLFAVDTPVQNAAPPPLAYATAMDDLTFEVQPSTDAQLEAAFRPYLKMLDDGTDSDLAEAMLAVTTLPQPFFLSRLEAMLSVSVKERRWDRKQALEGLARLGTSQAWNTIAAIARGKGLPPHTAGQGPHGEDDDSLRAYAVLLLGEKADAAFVPKLLELVSTASEDLRGAALRALGFFHDARANQVLFERLHSTNATDRVNAILGLKNLESPAAVPALMAMLNDPEAKVRQVANFALESLTGREFSLSPNASRGEAARVGQRWHAWWRENAGHFVPVRQPACHDW